jgi:hypothetical protein
MALIESAADRLYQGHLFFSEKGETNMNDFGRVANKKGKKSKHMRKRRGK